MLAFGSIKTFSDKLACDPLCLALLACLQEVVVAIRAGNQQDLQHLLQKDLPSRSVNLAK